MEFVNLYDYVVNNFENITEIKNKHLFLLNQLSTATNISNETFFKTTKDINNMGQIIIGIEEDIIICSGTIIIEPKLIYGAKSAAHIEDVVVLKEWRKMGIAQKLLDHLQNIAVDANCYKIILDCQENLESFYEKTGFKKRGIQMAQYLCF